MSPSLTSGPVSCRTVTSVFRMLTIIRATREDDLPTIAARGKCRSYFLNNRLKKNAPRFRRACRHAGKYTLSEKTKAPRLGLESRRSSNSPPPELLIHKLQSPDSSGNGTAVPLG